MLTVIIIRFGIKIKIHEVKKVCLELEFYDVHHRIDAEVQQWVSEQTPRAFLSLDTMQEALIPVLVFH